MPNHKGSEHLADAERGEVLDRFGRSARRSPEELVRAFKLELADIRRDLADRDNQVSPSQNLGLNGLLNGVFGGSPWQTQTLSQPWTLANANAYTPISLNRILLSYSYMTQGLIRTVVQQPVDDAFKGGFKLKSSQLDPDEILELQRAMKRTQPRNALRKMGKTVGGWVNYNACADLARSDVSAIKHAGYWGRLYGGAGLIANTDQDFKKPLDVEAIREDSPLVFIPADRWELVLSNINIYDYKQPAPYDYYGYQLHTSRVMKFIWNEAPSYIRLRLQGWGMSEIEQCIRSIQAFLKFENLMFELLDEAKIDVWKMKNYNSSLLSATGTERVRQAVWLTNQLKSYSNAIVMDSQDEYEQKKLDSLFTGLASCWEQLRLNLCSDLKIPRNKLFGESAGGFSSGEDSLENYNCVVEGVREVSEPLVLEVAGLRCQQLHGFVPDDLEVEWPSLRVMKQTDMEEVATKKQKRTMDLLDAGLYDAREASEVLQKDDLLPIETKVLKGKSAGLPREVEVAQFAEEAARRGGRKRAFAQGDPDKRAAA